MVFIMHCYIYGKYCEIVCLNLPIEIMLSLIIHVHNEDKYLYSFYKKILVKAIN